MQLKKWEHETIKSVAAEQLCGEVVVDFLELVNVGVLALLQKKSQDSRFISETLVRNIARRRMIDYKLQVKYLGTSGRGGSIYRRYKTLQENPPDAPLFVPIAEQHPMDQQKNTEEEAFLSMAIENAKEVLGGEMVHALLEGQTNEEIRWSVPGTRWRDVQRIRRTFREILSGHGI